VRDAFGLSESLNMDEVLSVLLTHYINSLREFRIKTQNTENERDEQIIRATRSLKAADEQRRGRAEHADVQDRVQKLNSALASIRERNERSAYLTL
jgi:uncharacterized protein YlxW (UPF0749 family)